MNLEDLKEISTVEFIEFSKVHGTKLFIFKVGEAYGCFFEGRREVKLMSCERSAMIEGACSYQVITGKKLPKR